MSPAYYFESKTMQLRAVTLNPSADTLPDVSPDEWRLRAKFLLGVQQPTPFGLPAEPILRGIRARGYFVWTNAMQRRPMGTSQ